MYSLLSTEDLNLCNGIKLDIFTLDCAGGIRNLPHRCRIRYYEL